MIDAFSEPGAGMDELSKAVKHLLHEAAEVHHRVYRITDGSHEDWASWYAHWLVHLSELPDVLGVPLVRSELTYMLVKLERDYADRDVSVPWDDYYARELVAHFVKR